MIIDENKVYFNKDEDLNSIKDYAENLWKAKFNLGLYIGNQNIIKNVEGYDFSFLNMKEKEQIVSLLKKEREGERQIENNIFDKKIFFFFALLDFIVSNKIPHRFKYDGEAGYFEGIFQKEFLNIENINGANPLSFYSMKKKKPQLDLNACFISVAEQVRENFISDMTKKEYNEYLAGYIKFKKEIENKQY